jgi:hypothetical protein
MTRARRRALPFLLIAALAAAGALVATARHEAKELPTRPLSQRPALLLVTSLPLLFNESFSLQGGGSPALSKLQTRYRVVPISVTGASDLSRGRLLLMAHPQAQTAENLVALDDWVRGGGRLLLLADPLLEWPSERPLGDPLRPPPMFMDTGLLAHWGLRLDAPDQRGPAVRRLADFDVLTVSPGRLVGRCAISADALVAQCRIGKGEAIVVADADLLDVNRLGPQAQENLDGLIAELARLEEK